MRGRRRGAGIVDSDVGRLCGTDGPFWRCFSIPATPSRCQRTQHAGAVTSARREAPGKSHPTTPPTRSPHVSAAFVEPVVALDAPSFADLGVTEALVERLAE